MRNVKLLTRWVISTLFYAASASLVGAQEIADDCVLCDEGANLISRYALVESPIPVRDHAGWSPPERIVVYGDDEFADPLSSIATTAEIVGVSNFGDLPAAVVGADVYVGFCTPAILEAGTNLKWIQLFGAGAENCADIPGISERNIIVTNAQRIFGSQIAEHAMAMTLSFARNLDGYRDQQRSQSWVLSTDIEARVLSSGLWELDQKTMLVVGLGGIGTEVARLAHAFGMRVIATRNSRREGPDFVEYVGLAHEVNELAAQADVIVSAVPLTTATRGMFDQAFFNSMRSTAYFINVGRGESVVTDDLVAALQSGRVAGAGLDVSDPEPLPRGHPLWDIPNVILTPHIAVASEDLMQRILVLTAENLRRYVAGEPMLSVVDLTRGY